MDIVSVVSIGLGLSADAFFVVMLLLSFMGNEAKKFKSIIPVLFAGVQAVMLALGWLLGVLLFQFVGLYVHWIACGLLVAIGGKIIHALVFRKHEHKLKQFSAPHFTQLLFLSIATSIDSLPAGISIGLLKFNIINAAIIITLITVAMITLAFHVGWRFAEKHVRRVAFTGALFLVAIGIRIFLYHLPA
ncbi:MAG: manganese efflux pump [Bacteroidota bacterium]